MAPHDENPTTVEVNKEDLRRAGDLILTRLLEVQTYISDLGRAYIQHVKTITETGDAVIELPVGPSGFMGFESAMRAGSPSTKSEAGGPKKRKRAPVDPNAPKRPLTPYFLFMKHNRGPIASDLGADSRPKEVADEGTRRWQAMEDTEKENWKELYAKNYAQYKEDVAAYKAGAKFNAGEDEPEAEAEPEHENENEDPAANQLQQDFAGAEAKGEDAESSSDSSDEESPSPPTPVKEKTPPRSSAKKTRQLKAKEVETPAKARSPVKRGVRKAAAPAEPEPEPKTPAENKRKTKKRKSEA